MFYYMPTKVYEEAECVKNHGAEWTALGRKAMIVTGRSSAKKNGSYADVAETLDAHGAAHVLFDEVEENPSIETVMKAREIGLAEGVDFVIGIGGGSPMDASKAIAMMICQKDKDASCLYTPGEDAALPVVAVPTTCGTGSEATPYSVLTIHAKGTKGSIKHKIFPRYALVDAKYLAFAPQSVLCSTAVDAIGHVFESYVNSNATDYSRMCNAKALEIWARTKDVLLGAKEGTTEDYRNLMNASTIAGISISMTGTSLPHGLSYPVTYNTGMPHGKAIGYFQYGYLREADKTDREYLMQLTGFADLDAWQEFYQTICQPGEVDAALLEKAAEETAVNPIKLKNCPYEVDREKMLRIVGLR